MTQGNVTRLFLNGKEIILIGTAHVSKQSAEEVKEVIEREQPDSVCVELDQQRYQSLKDNNKWQKMDIFQVIKEKKATLLLVNMIVSSFQRRIAKQFGIKPGQEMIQGIESAEEIGAELVLADRDIQITFKRIWRNLNLTGKAKLMMAILYSIFDKEEITEEQLEQLKSKDMLDSALSEFTEAFPQLKKPLIDERDQYLAQKIKNAPGHKVVAVLGAAHVPGITKQIEKEHNLKKLTTLPKKTNKMKIVAWAIPIIIIAAIAYTFFNNPSAGVYQAISWALWNGSLSAIGAAIAFAHPLAILTAFVVAPISSLNPVLAAGWFSGAVQAYMRKPSVSDFESLSDDVFSLKGFWSNKVTRVLLVVVITNIGSSLGTFVGGFDVIRVFIDNL